MKYIFHVENGMAFMFHNEVGVNRMTRKTDLEDRIIRIQNELSVGERRLAAVIFELEGNIAGFTGGELSDRAGVSASTTARFFRRLGYASYQEVRTEARDTSMKGSPLDVYRKKNKDVDHTSDFSIYIEKEKQNLAQTYAEISQDLLEKAADILKGSGTIYIIGFRNSYAIALFLRNQLSVLRNNIRLIPAPGEDVATDLIDQKAGDVLLAVGLRRRTVVLGKTISRFHKNGGEIVFLTDLTAPSWQEERVVTLRCITESPGSFDSYATPMCVLNYLLSLLQQSYRTHVEERFSEVETIRTEIYGTGSLL
ncbi:MurR/RpiR family transcriptional regulator [Acetobacter malorum]|uniref:MurR/RpiR family transcriptional regulator n=1 Tax=Acetobacter malorum TaxID=178901 RepID=UPI0039EA2A82